MTHKPGKLKEKVVTILERHIDQKAKVSCDVMMPVISNPALGKRQVDVLIETGTKDRPTRTIVEVQDRKSKPSRLEFDGWLEKMREVGAQHLMCVTSAGFPNSIVEKASTIGPTVRLFTLEQLEEARGALLPPTIMSNQMLVVAYEKLQAVQVVPIHPVQLHPSLDPSISPDPHAKIFHPHGSQVPVSTTDVVDFHLFRFPKNIEELPQDGTKFTLKFGYDVSSDAPWKFIEANGWVELKRFDVIINLRIHTHPIEWEHHAYEQIGSGEKGWILKGTTNYDGKETLVYLPLRKEGNGLYSAGRATALSENAATFVSYGNIGHKAGSFQNIENS
ncbi:MAG: hypothetical protein ACTSRN_06830 [Alphaproteobacteria bacterium]